MAQEDPAGSGGASAGTTVDALHATLQNGGVQQRVGRLTTADGNGLAYATIGDGRPLVYVSGWPERGQGNGTPIVGQYVSGSQK